MWAMCFIQFPKYSPFFLPLCQPASESNSSLGEKRYSSSKSSQGHSRSHSWPLKQPYDFNHFTSRCLILLARPVFRQLDCNYLPLLLEQTRVVSCTKMCWQGKTFLTKRNKLVSSVPEHKCQSKCASKGNYLGLLSFLCERAQCTKAESRKLWSESVGEVSVASLSFRGVRLCAFYHLLILCFSLGRAVSEKTHWEMQQRLFCQTDREQFHSAVEFILVARNVCVNLL